MSKDIYERKAGLMCDLEQAIATIGKEMDQVIRDTEVFDRQMQLLCSIDGVGP